MSAKTPAELIYELSPIVTEVGLELDDLKLSKAGKYRVLEIAVDGDFVDLDKIAEVSRALSVYLDEKNPLGEQPYTLEVTTRGIDRPLVKPVHWQRNVSRLVKVTGEAVELIGRITKFENPTVTLDVNGKIIEIDINTISSALIQVEFSRREVVGEQD
jgi:ribosome maturation factor RimP